MLGECWKEVTLQEKFYIGFQKAKESLFPQRFLLPIFSFTVATRESKGTGLQAFLDTFLILKVQTHTEVENAKNKYELNFQFSSHVFFK